MPIRGINYYFLLVNQKWVQLLQKYLTKHNNILSKNKIYSMVFYHI